MHGTHVYYSLPIFRAQQKVCSRPCCIDTRSPKATAAEQRATDLASQLQRQQAQHEREIAQLRESQAATAAALRQLETRSKSDDKPDGARPKRSAKGAERLLPTGGARPRTGGRQ
jgi:hypothetical protein